MHALTRSLVAVAAFSFAPHAFASGCPVLPDKSLQCVATEHGWFYATDAATAAGFASAAADDARQFPRYFGRPAARGVVLSTVPSDEARRALKTAGAEWILPFPPTRRPYRDETEARNVLRHEIGHALYGAAFEANGKPRRGAPGSGSDGPYWLNEAAAMLMEDGSGAVRYRRDLLTARDEKGPERKLKPLADFVVTGHPLARMSFQPVVGKEGVASMVAVPGGAGGPAMVAAAPATPGEAGAAPPRAGGARAPGPQGARAVPAPGNQAGVITVSSTGESVFYEQSFGFTQFLLARSSKEGVLGSLAQAFAAGGDMAAWLRAHGADYGLPGTVDALDRQWRDWLGNLPAQEAKPD